MINGGLVSITFRKLSVEAIVALVVRAQLKGIEWGGDIHVPHGNVARAGHVRKLTEDAGLQCAAYGSYYRLGTSEQAGELSFASVLDSAIALGAPLLRVWAGNRSSADVDDTQRSRIADEARRVGELAAAAKIEIGLEFHGGTLTDTIASTKRLFAEIDHSNVKSLWQPERGISAADGAASLRRILPWLTNMHVFHWSADGRREPFSAGEDNWRQYLAIARSTQRDHWALLEFVQDDVPENFLRDAAVLRKLL